MKPSFRVWISGGAAVLALATGSGIQAQDAAKADVEPMALQGIMHRLGQDMQAVVAAIAIEDWVQVAGLAPKIARHPEPPLMEKVRILTWLGTDALKFRGFDGQAEKAASEMAEAAGRGDGPAVIAAFAATQNACLGCHQGYRQKFIEHFYGGR